MECLQSMSDRLGTRQRDNVSEMTKRRSTPVHNSQGAVLRRADPFAFLQRSVKLWIRCSSFAGGATKLLHAMHRRSMTWQTIA